MKAAIILILVSFLAVLSVPVSADDWDWVRSIGKGEAGAILVPEGPCYEDPEPDNDVPWWLGEAVVVDPDTGDVEVCVPLEGLWGD